jgi:putative hydrolase of the HAD superfamily
VARELLPPHHHATVHVELGKIGDRLLNRHCELLPGVEPTLADLAKRHRLLLFSKGQPREQMRKLERSGLRPLFSRVGIPVEKDAIAYRLLMAQAELEPSRTVMIGNSPRSDINPALKAGLRAVYIPHPHTWELEHEELELSDDRLMTLPSFPHLLEVF